MHRNTHLYYAMSLKQKQNENTEKTQQDSQTVNLQLLRSYFNHFKFRRWWVKWNLFLRGDSHIEEIVSKKLCSKFQLWTRLQNFKKKLEDAEASSRFFIRIDPVG
jgi:hypothetical protein